MIAWSYVKNRPILLAAMWLAFLVNLFAFPFVLGLLPYAAKIFISPIKKDWVF